MWFNRFARNSKKIKVFYKLTKNKTKNLGNQYIKKIKKIQNSEKYQRYILRMKQIKNDKYQRYILQMEKIKKTNKYKKYLNRVENIKTNIKTKKRYLQRLSERLKLRKKKKKKEIKIPIKTFPIYKWKENYIYEKNIQKYKIFQGSAYLILLKKLILPSTLILAKQYFLAILPSISFILSFAFFYNFNTILKRGISDISYDPENNILIFKNYDVRFEIGKNDLKLTSSFFNSLFFYEFGKKRYYVLNIDRVRKIENEEANQAILNGDIDKIQSLFSK